MHIHLGFAVLGRPLEQKRPQQKWPPVCWICCLWEQSIDSSLLTWLENRQCQVTIKLPLSGTVYCVSVSQYTTVHDFEGGLLFRQDWHQSVNQSLLYAWADVQVYIYRKTYWSQLLARVKSSWFVLAMAVPLNGWCSKPISYSWTPLSRTNSLLSRTKWNFPWICPYFFSHLLWAISNSVISNTLLSRTVSCSPKLKSTPAISNFSMFRRNICQHQSGSAVKAPPDKMYWKLRNGSIDMFAVTKAKSDWLLNKCSRRSSIKKWSVKSIAWLVNHSWVVLQSFWGGVHATTTSNRNYLVDFGHTHFLEWHAYAVHIFSNMSATSATGVKLGAKIAFKHSAWQHESVATDSTAAAFSELSWTVGYSFVGQSRRSDCRMQDNPYRALGRSIFTPTTPYGWGFPTPRNFRTIPTPRKNFRAIPPPRNRNFTQFPAPRNCPEIVPKYSLPLPRRYVIIVPFPSFPFLRYMDAGAWERGCW